MLFVKRVKNEGRYKKPLEVGRSLDIHLSNGNIFKGAIVDFISESHNAHNIFVDGNPNQRCQLKIYSNRTMVELVVYDTDVVNAYKVDHITVTCNGRQEILDTNHPDGLVYFTDEKQEKLVPVEVGDIFSKHDKQFKLLAISRDERMLFLEDTISGAGITVSHRDDVLIKTFRGFEWGTPTL
ncbi:hypothetical protein CkP1_0104 [Citrobacter phage CkP1]|nr:hypothetical protein CkP1_0104 [Citrobacter phage CkP1]